MAVLFSGLFLLAEEIFFVPNFFKVIGYETSV